MEDLTGKITNSNLTAAEWNQLPQEVQNVITSWAALAGDGDLNQLGKAAAAYAAASQFYTGTHGSGTAYIATPLSGIQAPPVYNTGMVVRFRPSIQNTGPPTVNVATLGVKNIKQENGAALIAGDMDTDRDCYLVYDGTDFLLSNWSRTASPSTPTVPPGHLSKMVTSRIDDDTFQITAGRCRNLADTVTLVLPALIAKNIGSAGWVAGTGNNGQPTGVALTANTPYHMFVIHKDSDGAVDGGIDSSLTAANLLADSGYDNYRRVGTFRLDATSDIIDWRQVGDYFERFSDHGGVTWSGTSQTFDADELLIPDDFRVIVNCSVFYNKGGDGFGWLYPGDDSRAASTSSHNFGCEGADDIVSMVQCLTSPTGTLDLDASATADTNSKLNTWGYYDRRGQDGVEPTV